MAANTDQDLIQRVLQSDLEAFGQIVTRYQGLVFGVAYSILRDSDNARDVAQDVFIRAFTRLSQVHDTNKLGPWLRQVTANECRAWQTRNRFSGALPEDLRSSGGFEMVDDRIAVTIALQALDERSRLTTILFYLHAYSHKEIGAFLEEPETTIKSRLRNVRAKLRKELETRMEENLNREQLPTDFGERLARLIKAVHDGDQGTVRALIGEDARLLDVNEIPSKHTPLHVAAAAGNDAMVELFLAHGADPSARDNSDNATPLHYAAERGRLETARLLLDAGADVNFVDDFHEGGPLGWAILFNPMQIEMAEYLIRRGARITIFPAIALAREDVIRDLVAQNPDVLKVRLSEFDGRRSVIDFAGGKRQFGIAKLLAELGAEVGLIEAAAMGDAETVTAKLPQKPEKEALDKAIKASVRAAQIETTRLLLEAGADPDFAPQGTSLIFDALSDTNEELARLLLDNGANLEFRDNYWKATALGWEVFYGRPGGVKLGLALGAKPDPHLIDTARDGQRGQWRPYTTASATDYQQVAELLASC